ncbi:unnamed protein product [Rhizophagus irregularis]|nr:unnamed protein product [Rhizophagus irregularis]
MSEYDDELISPKSKIIMLQKEISELKRKSDPLNKSKSISTQKTSTSIQNNLSIGIIKPAGNYINIPESLCLPKEEFNAYKSDIRDLVEAFTTTDITWINQEKKTSLKLIEKFKANNPQFPKTAGDWAIKLMIKRAINNKRAYKKTRSKKKQKKEEVKNDDNIDHHNNHSDDQFENNDQRLDDTMINSTDNNEELGSTSNARKRATQDQIDDNNTRKRVAQNKVNDNTRKDTRSTRKRIAQNKKSNDDDNHNTHKNACDTIELDISSDNEKAPANIERSSDNKKDASGNEQDPFRLLVDKSISEGSSLKTKKNQKKNQKKN